MLKLLHSFKTLLVSDLKAVACKQQTAASLHTTAALDSAWNKRNQGPKRFILNNKTIFEPQKPDEKPRPAFVCHQKTNIKYSPKKMWYLASFIRGMTVDEALKQLSFNLKKASADIKQTILEAQEMAVKNHNVEFKSNMWIAESFCGKGKVVKGVRRHGRARMGRVEYKYVHYFLRLEEGTPPEHYYLPYPLTPEQQLEKWQEEMRNRKVINSL